MYCLLVDKSSGSSTQPTILPAASKADTPNAQVLFVLSLYALLFVETPQNLELVVAALE